MQRTKTGAEMREGEFSNLSTCMGSHTCHQDEERRLKKKKKMWFPVWKTWVSGRFQCGAHQYSIWETEKVWSVESSWSLDWDVMVLNSIAAAY